MTSSNEDASREDCVVFEDEICVSQTDDQNAPFLREDRPLSPRRKADLRVLEADLPAPLEARVYYEDTDAGGVMYHASYLRFAERARTEWLRAIFGRDKAMWTKSDPVFVVRHLEVDYEASAKLDDFLTVTTELVRIGGASMEMNQFIKRDSLVLAKMKMVLVALTHDGKVLRIPAEWRQTLSRYVTKGA